MWSSRCRKNWAWNQSLGDALGVNRIGSIGSASRARSKSNRSNSGILGFFFLFFSSLSNNFVLHTITQKQWSKSLNPLQKLLRWDTWKQIGNGATNASLLERLGRLRSQRFDPKAVIEVTESFRFDLFGELFRFGHCPVWSKQEPQESAHPSLVMRRCIEVGPGIHNKLLSPRDFHQCFGALVLHVKGTNYIFNVS